MIVKFKCWQCGADVQADATPMSLEDTQGQEGFFEFDIDCPKCGENLETVIREKA
ncbi:MAG: hypothetical protein ACYDHX_07840 [Methanothrix sp.]